MPIQFSCTHCGKRGQAPDLAVGKKVKCPHCEKINSVPTPDGFEQLLPPPVVPPPTITPTAPKPARKLPSWVRSPRLSWRAWLIMSGLAFLLTLRTPPGPWVLLHYLALIFAVGLLATRIAQPRVPQWSKWIALGAALLAAWLWGRSDYYIKHEDKFRENGDLESVITEYVYRSQYRPFYQETSVWTEKGYGRLEGGYSESGKRHGRWKSFSTDDITGQTEWYWYGEPITEGEWHLRNK